MLGATLILKNDGNGQPPSLRFLGDEDTEIVKKESSSHLLDWKCRNFQAKQESFYC